MSESLREQLAIILDELVNGKTGKTPHTTYYDKADEILALIGKCGATKDQYRVLWDICDEFNLGAGGCPDNLIREALRATPTFSGGEKQFPISACCSASVTAVMGCPGGYKCQACGKSCSLAIFPTEQKEYCECKDPRPYDRICVN